MNAQKTVVQINIPSKNINDDIEIPLSITVQELLDALSKIYQIKIDWDNMSNCYLKTEHPIMFIKGSNTLASYGIRTGTVINIVE